MSIPAEYCLASFLSSSRDPRLDDDIASVTNSVDGGLVDISSPEITVIDRNDGTFFMCFDDWFANYTHFFAGIDFPIKWQGKNPVISYVTLQCAYIVRCI
jgi:hypothetical protein